jgi:transposase
MIGILGNDRIATLKAFLRAVPQERVKEVCIDMKASLMKLVQEMFPLAKLVLDRFHVIADANRRVDEARRIEQDVRGKKVSIPKWPFLKGSEKLTQRQKDKRDRLLASYPALSGFYWAKEKLREMYRLETGEQAAQMLDLIIFNLRAEDDGELIRWGNTLKRWREPILNHFISRTTNAYTEGCHTKIKMLKRTSYGLRNVEVYRRKMLLAFTPTPASFHTL